MSAIKVLRGIAVLTCNPALGGGGIGPQRASELLHQFATLVEKGNAKSLEAFHSEIDQLVANHGSEGRGQFDRIRKLVEETPDPPKKRGKKKSEEETGDGDDSGEGSES